MLREMRLAPLLVGLLVPLSACARQVAYAPNTTLAPRISSSPDAIVYLVGDAGKAGSGRDSVLAAVRADVLLSERTHPAAAVHVVFLGDNIYEEGARASHSAVDRPLLDAQVAVLDSVQRARATFVPGNHDWGKGARDDAGAAAVRLQADWLRGSTHADRVSIHPQGACPGPSLIDVGSSARLIFLDTEWMLRTPESVCSEGVGVGQRLEELLGSDAGGRHIILAGHHPMATGGPHGGNVGLFESGPLVYYLAVKSGLSIQDLASPRYDAAMGAIREAIRRSGRRPLAYASGHEHSLQLIGLEGSENPHWQLVSGTGAKLTPVSRVEGTRFAVSEYGFIRLALSGPSATATVFSGPEGSRVRPVFQCALWNRETTSCSEAPRVTESTP